MLSVTNGGVKAVVIDFSLGLSFLSEADVKLGTPVTAAAKYCNPILRNYYVGYFHRWINVIRRF